MQTRGKTGMARQKIFKQTSGNKSEHRKCANKFKQQLKQSNRSSNQTDQAKLANKQIKQTNRSSNQTDQANKQIKQTNRSSKQADQANKQNRHGKHSPCSQQAVQTSRNQSNKRKPSERRIQGQ
jgi:hypothetical protein